MSLKKQIQQVIDICKIGQGSNCCKYLVAGEKGFECMKINPANKKVIDDNWAHNKHVAQGDNCDGKEDLTKDE